MASSSAEDQSRARASSSAAEDQSKTVMGYPPTLGYPQEHASYPPGHPGYPPAYPGYPTTSNPYPYTAAPPAAYYTSQPYPPQPQQPRRSSTCARRVLAVLVILVIVTCMSSIITWLILRPQIPVFRVDSLSVSAFNISNSKLTANWDANITVGNPNQKLKVSFDRIESYMFYKDNFLVMTLEEPFSLGTKEQGTMDAMLATVGLDKSVVGDEVVEEMGKDRSNGTVSFSLRMALWVTFKTSSWWTRHTTIRVFCENLKVGFPAATGAGMLTGSGPRECLVDV